MSVRDLFSLGGTFTMTPHRSASTNITGYSYVSQDRLLATTIKVVGTFDGESISSYGFEWSLDDNNWHKVVLYNGSWTNVQNITGEKNIRIEAIQGSAYLRSYITRKDTATTYSPSVIYRYNNVMRLSVTGLISNDFTSNARASEINAQDGYQYVVYDPATDEITGFDTELGLVSLDLRDTDTTELGRNAFKGCTNLETVYLPSTLQVIGENAFVDNEKLTSVDTYNVSEIGDNAFKGCVAMESLVIGEEVTEIGDNAFNGCSSLTDVTSYALEPPTLGTGNFTTSGDTLYVPNEALSAYQNDPDWSAAFSSIRPLQEYIRVDVVAGDHGTASGSGWYQMGDTVVISATADTGYHFTQWNDGNTDNPRTITVGATDVTYTASFLVDAGTVGNTSYSSLTYTSVTCSALFSGLDTTGYGFCYSTTNSSPNLNDTVVTIGTGTINASASASLINLTEATKYYIRGYITNAGGTTYNTAIEVSTNAYTIVYNASSEITGTWVDNNTDTTRNTYDSVSGNGVLYLNAGVSAIGGGDSSALSPFYGNSDLASADLTHSNIRILGSYAFYNCENMTTVDLGSTVTTIGNYTFYHCEGLESINLTGITSIGNNAFNTCSSLETLTIPSTVTTISDNAFDNCTSLETLVLPSTLQRIGVASFGHCDSLASVTCYATSVPTLGLDNFTIMNDTLYVPYASVATYLAVPAWQTAFVSIRPIGDYSYITVNNGGHGTTTGGGWYLNGTYAQISATPDSHYHFVQWGDGDTNATRSVLVTQDEVYSAVFAIDQHTITVSAGNHGSATGSGTYDYGSTVQISATPDTDYHFTSWNDGNIDNPRTITVTGDATYTASFSIDEYTLTVTGDAHTTVTGSGTYPTGTSVQIEATPDSHYHFVSWSDGNTTNPRTITVTSNITLSASSAIDTHTITVTSDAHGTASGSGTYNYGDTATISITPDSNYHFVSWNDGNTSNPRSVTVTGDATYSGTTAIDQYTLTVTGDLNTTVTGSGTYDYGTSVQITATPNTHYHFVAWSDGDTNATRTVVVTSNMTLSATSAIDTYVVTVTGDANTDTTSGSGTYGYGSSVTISATPVAHYHFARWQDSNTDNPRTITVTSDVTYTATTAIDQHVITTQGDSHIASVTGGGLYNYGTQVTLTATPDTGYHFVSWTDGDTDNPRTITVTGDETYRATSALNIYTITVNGDAHTASTTGSGQWGYGSQFQISATPDSNYHFVAWNDGNTDNPRYITVTGDATYTASMAIDTYTLTVLSDDVNEGSVSGGGTYNYGTSVQISATAESGYEFVEWNDSNTDNPRTITVTSNATYTAYFQASVVQYTVGVYSGDPNVGSVTGGGTYNAGATCTIEAFVEDLDYEFECWQDDVVFSTIYDNPFSFTVDGDINFTANFIPYVPPVTTWNVTLTVNDPTMGEATGDGTYDEGDLVEIEATAYTGYVFDGWYQNGVLVESSNPYQFNIYSDETYQAHFSVAGQTYDVTLYSDDATMGDVTGDGEYSAGTDVIIEAIPNVGYQFAYWLDTLTNINYDNPATIYNLSQNESWTAYFEAEPAPPQTWNVDLYVNDSQYGSVTGDGEYMDGQYVAIQATPASHCMFLYWDDGAGNYEYSNPYSFYIDGDKEYTAYFAPDLNTVTVEANNSNYGTTNPSGASQGMYWIGVDTITMEATPNTGYYFDHWEQSNGTFVSSSNPVTVVTSYPATYIAVFVQNQIRYNATSAATGNWVTNNTDTSANTWNSQTGDGVLYLNSGVTSIGGGASTDYSPFYQNTAVVSVDLTDSGITSLLNGAFNHADNLTNVVLPTTITQIGTSADNKGVFEHCGSLVSINLEDTQITEIGKWCFANDSSLTSITIPSGVTIIGQYAFNSCSNLLSVTCEALTRPTLYLNNFTANNDTLYVHYSALSSYQNTNSWFNAFTYIKPIESVIAYNASSAVTGTWVATNTDTTKNTWDSVTGDGLLYLNSGVTSIGGGQSANYSPFFSKSDLTSVTLPEGITTVGDYAFAGCDSLLSVSCESTTPPTLGTNNFTITGDTLHVPYSSISTYEANSAWVNAFTDIKPIEKIIRYNATAAMSGTWVTNNTFITKNTYDSVSDNGVLFLKNNVTTIDYNNFSFNNNTNLISVDLTDSGITSLRTSFKGSTNLTTVVLGSSITSLGIETGSDSGVFEGCSSLTSVNLEDTSITYTGSYLFQDCTSLTSVTLPSTVTRISTGTFRGCTGLTSFTIPSNVTTVDGSAFQNCTSLASMVIPESVTTISQSAIYGCTNLMSVTSESATPPSLGTNNFTASGDTLYVPIGCAATYQASTRWLNSFTTISEFTPNAIRYNSSTALTGNWITSNTYTSGNTWDSNTGDGVFYLKRNATLGGGESTDYSPFYNNRDVVSVDLSDSGLTTLDNYALYSCRGMSAITMPSNLQVIGGNALCDCRAITSITLPASVTAIGSGAFNQCYGLQEFNCLATTPPALSDNNFQIWNDTIPTGMTFNPHVVLYVPDASFETYANSYTWDLCFMFISIYGLTDPVLVYKGISYGLTTWAVNNTDTSKYRFAGDASYGGHGIFFLNNGATIGGGTIFRMDTKNYSPFCGRANTFGVSFKDSNITTINSYAFYQCPNMTTVLINDTMSEIKSTVFNDCPSLMAVTSLATTPPTLSSSGNFGASGDVLYVPGSAVSAYQSDSNWNSVFSTKTYIN